MKRNRIHVYLMPGLAANPSIFESIKLPESEFKTHYLKWLMPSKKETLEHYALRISKNIKHENPILVGVSFGGILVQEMSKHINVKKLVIISSVKTNQEFPKHIKIAKAIKLYKLLPTKLIKNIDRLATYSFGKTTTRSIALYKKYLSVTNPHYLKWAIKQLVTWTQKTPIENIIHIHGESDNIFPIKNISNCISLKGGSHIMIITKTKWFNTNLPIVLKQ